VASRRCLGAGAGCGRLLSVGSEHLLQAAEMTKASAGAVEAGVRMRGVAIARPEHARERKYSCGAQSVARSDVGDSASDELLGTAEIRTPAFRRSARVRGIVRPVAATSVPAGGVLRVLPREGTCRADAPSSRHGLSLSGRLPLAAKCQLASAEVAMPTRTVSSGLLNVARRGVSAETI
jgi:hypothetical protein